jgi:hypothetical protein
LINQRALFRGAQGCFQLATCGMFAGKQVPAQFGIAVALFIFTLRTGPTLRRRLAAIFHSEKWMRDLSAQELAKALDAKALERQQAAALADSQAAAKGRLPSPKQQDRTLAGSSGAAAAAAGAGTAVSVSSLAVPEDHVHHALRYEVLIVST